MSTLTLDHSWALWLGGLAVPYVVLRFLIRRSRAIDLPPLQFHPASVAHRALSIVPLLLEASLLALLGIAAAGPYAASSREFVSETGSDIAMCLDVSLSMQAADIQPTRLEALKSLTSEFVKKGCMNRIAIYAFAGEVFTQCSLTSDPNVLLELIDGLSYESIDHALSGGSAVGDAILFASQGLLEQRLPGRGQAVLLVTDGESNFGIDPHIAARAARENGIHLYVIGIGGNKAVEVHVHGNALMDADGKPFTTKSDDTQLKEIARTAQGKYWRADTAGVLANVFDEVSKLEKTPLRVEQFTLKRPLCPGLALGVLLLFGAWLCLEGLILRRPFR